MAIARQRFHGALTKGLRFLHHHRRLYWFLRRARLRYGANRPPRSFPEIPGRVHRNDLMLEATTPELVENYRAQGLKAVEFVERAMAASGRDLGDVEAFLDFGCGHGRVLRFVAERIPGDRITACDLDPEAVAFCASEFGAIPLVSSIDLVGVPLGTYDVIWMGSVLTHLGADDGASVIRHLVDHLRPHGLIVFTTHGQFYADQIEVFGADVDAHRTPLLQSLEARGFAYLPYAHYWGERYGLAWHTAEHVREHVVHVAEPSLVEVAYEPDCWSLRHDLWAFTRHPAPE